MVQIKAYRPPSSLAKTDRAVLLHISRNNPTTPPPDLGQILDISIPSHEETLQTITKSLVHIHAGCIMNDGTMCRFFPPLSEPKIEKWYQDKVLPDVESGLKDLIILLSPIESRTRSPQDLVPSFPGYGPKELEVLRLKLPSSEIDSSKDDVDYEVSGFVALSSPTSESGPFRALVELLLISPMHRRKGIARTVMQALEKIARSRSRWNVLLDTTVGTAAEDVYPRLGFARMGGVKDYGLNPLTGELMDEVWFGKDLRTEEEKTAMSKQSGWRYQGELGGGL